MQWKWKSGFVQHVNFVIVNLARHGLKVQSQQIFSNRPKNIHTTIHADRYKKNWHFMTLSHRIHFGHTCPQPLNSCCSIFASTARLCSNSTTSSLQGLFILKEILMPTHIRLFHYWTFLLRSKYVTETNSGISIPERNKHEYLSLVHSMFLNAFFLVQHKWKHVASRYSTIVARTTIASAILAEGSRGKKREVQCFEISQTRPWPQKLDDPG